MDTEKNLTVNISLSTIVKSVFFLIALYVLYLVKDIALVVLTAVVIASAVDPGVRWLMRRKMSRVLSVLAVYVGMGTILVGIVYSFVPLLLSETSNFLSSVPEYVDTVSLWSPLESHQAETVKTVAGQASYGIAASKATISGISNTVTANSAGTLREIISSINNTLSTVSGGAIHILSVVFGGILGFVLIVVISFYLSVQENGVEKFLKIVTPKAKELYVIDLWNRTQRKIGRWMQGQIILAVIMGVLVYLGLTVLGVKNALMLATLAAIFEIIPMFGPIFSAIVGTVVAFSVGGVSLALFTAGLYLIIHQFENHLIYPLVVTRIVGVPPILVIISLIVGAKLAGFLGVILSVPLSSFLVEIIDDFERRKVVRG
jgi:predicted PurR-regulated permease PerM